MVRKTLCSLMLLGAALAAQQLDPVTLPKPNTTGGVPLMQAIAARRSTREFTAEKISPQLLSNLLWAGFGINRPDGRRTAPSAMNWQEIDVFVVLAEGIYRYDAKANQLVPVAAGDHRALAGTQDFVRTAPVNLVYVADFKKTGGASPDRQFFAGADTGFIAQNVYLFCASEGLGTVVRGSIDSAAFAKVANLRADQKVTLAQTVGYGRR